MIGWAGDRRELDATRALSILNRMPRTGEDFVLQTCKGCESFRPWVDEQLEKLAAKAAENERARRTR
jgi:hypothetical protein